jgi:hypothetical protein
MAGDLTYLFEPPLAEQSHCKVVGRLDGVSLSDIMRRSRIAHGVCFTVSLHKVNEALLRIFPSSFCTR